MLRNNSVGFNEFEGNRTTDKCEAYAPNNEVISMQSGAPCVLILRWVKTIGVCAPSQLGKQPASLIKLHLHWNTSPGVQYAQLLGAT